MPISGPTFRIPRRTFLGAGLAAGALRVSSPFVRSARAADAIRIGLDNPLTGTYAALGQERARRLPNGA